MDVTPDRIRGKSKQTTSIQIPEGKRRKWERLARESGMTTAKYARSAVVHAIESGLTFKEVKTVSVKVINQQDKTE